MARHDVFNANPRFPTSPGITPTDSTQTPLDFHAPDIDFGLFGPQNTPVSPRTRQGFGRMSATRSLIERLRRRRLGQGRFSRQGFGQSQRRVRPDLLF